MALFRFLDTKDLETYATSLAMDLGRRFPPSAEARTDPGAAQQLAIIIDDLAGRAVRYHQEHKLGVYRKAKLGNVFQWKLADLGYSKGFVERATKEIVTRLAAK